jgi:hypothetical protein
MRNLSRLIPFEEPTLVRVEFRDEQGRRAGWRDELLGVERRRAPSRAEPRPTVGARRVAG